MRTETQPYDRVRINAYYAVNGTPQTGLSPTVKVYRISDGNYLNGSNTWQSAAVDLSMTEVDSTDLPGLYTFAVPSAAISRTAGAAGYFAEVDKAVANDNDRETVFVAVSDPQGDVLSADLQPTTAWATGSIGDALLRMLSLRQQNTNVTYTSFAANGEPTAGTVYIYPNKAAADADTTIAGTGSIGSYTFTAAYDASLRLTSYRSTRAT